MKEMKDTLAIFIHLDTIITYERFKINYEQIYKNYAPIKLQNLKA